MMSAVISGIIILCLTGFLFFLFRYLTVKKHGIYSQRAIGLLHWPKWCLHFIALCIKHYERPRRLNNYDLNGKTYNYCGVVPTPSEIRLEQPKALITDRHDDGIFIWGGDEHGRIIVAKLVRLSRRRACVTLLVKTAEGTIYTIPNQPDSNVINVDNRECWQGSGLFLECIEPMRTWRVKYNGFLRKGSRDHYVTKDEDDDDASDFDKDPDDRNIIEARLDFLWTATRAPVDIWHDSSLSLLADAIAREPGADSTSYEALERDGYDQWGILHGTIQLGPKTEQTLYLRGSRQHRWGMSDISTNFHRSINFFMYFKNGNMAWIEAFSYKSLISHGVFGYLQTASGSFLPMVSTNVELADMGEDGKIPKNICFELEAGGSKYQIWHRFSEGIEVHSGDPWSLTYDYCPSVTISSGHGEGWGLAVFSKRFTALCPVPEKQSLSIQKCSEPPPDGVFVLPFSDIACTFVPLTGGKGASLACLSKITTKSDDPDLRFKVPEGVVVTSDAWEKQVKDSAELSTCIKNLQKAVTSSQSNQIKETCDRIQKVLSRFKVCEPVKEAILSELEATFGSNLNRIRFAVRSSACGEDSDESSSAGQNATFLGCLWEGNQSTVLEALMLCWASQFTYQSVEYKRQRGQPLNDGMAVVIQRMISPSAAGVLFTRDPLTGSPANVLISANFGLGETVVSATCDPDTIIIQRSWRNKFRIRVKKTGDKKIKCIMKDDGGTEEVQVTARDRDSNCLSDELALKLAKIGLFVEDCYGSPRDIEFAIYENEVYLLQARPITSLHGWTDYELIHEADSPYISDDEIITIANTGEVFPGYICPLTISTVVKLLDVSLQKQLKFLLWPSYSPDVSYFRPISIFSSHCLLNFGELCLRNNESKITLVNNAVDLAICGRIVTTYEMLQWGIARFGIMNKLTSIARLSTAFYNLLMNPRRVRNCRPIFSTFEIDTSRATSSVSLYKEICRKLPEITEICETHGHVSSTSTATQCIALVTIAEDNKEINENMIQDISSLLSCIHGTESAQVPTSLEVIARDIADTEEVDDFLSMNEEEGRVWLESHPGVVGSSFREFITDHGHRCIKEFDLRTVSWGMAPESLVNSLQTMVKTPSNFGPNRKQDVVKVLDDMQVKLTPSKKRALKFIISMCGKAVNLRESTKSMVIKTVDAFRKAYRTLGLLMVSECRIPDADLIFFFHHREIDQLLKTRSAALVTKAVNRRRIMKDLENITFDEFCYGVPKPIASGDEALVNINTSQALTGTPVCLGTTQGTARVVTRLQDANTIQNGDILVTYSTDVGWTPYFPLLSGVVTEIGGLISHGAVVAREYGLPCVVGVKGATKAFKSGDRLFLNGKEGTIRKIE